MATIRTIYESYAKMVYFTAFGLCHDAELAADVLQTVFLRAMEHEGTVLRLKQKPLRAWLCKTARNALTDALRLRGRESPVEALPETPLPRAVEPEAALEASLDLEALDAALCALPALYRSPIELCYFAELSGREAAKLLGIKESTLRSRILRGKQMLREQLGGREDADGPSG